MVKSLNLYTQDCPGKRLKKIKHQMVDGVWQGMVVIAMIGVPLSVSRYFFTGWLDLYTFHLITGTSCLLVYFNRNRISLRTKSALLIAIFFCVGAVGLFLFGLLGAGVWWLVVSSFMMSTIYSFKWGVYSAAVTLVMIVLSGYLHVNQIITLPVDANAYATSVYAWLSFIVAATIMPIAVLKSIAVYQFATKELLREVEAQKEEIKKLATRDQLTGLLLLNMAADSLEKAIHRARRENKKAALLFIDLDGFKLINDTYGHAAGDIVLVETANRIRIAHRQLDSAARIGGDEFVVIIESLDNEIEALKVAKRILNELNKPIVFNGIQLSISASVGCAIYPDHAQDLRSLRNAADAAMYSVKRSGRNGFAFAKGYYDFPTSDLKANYN